jgi:3-oxoacyl-[acyl-carrier protein] reductase
MTTRPSALITGGSRGIGFAIATQLALRRWDLTISARGAEELERAKSELEVHGSTIHAVAVDVSGENAAHTLISEHDQSFHSLSALVIAAGVGTASPLEGYPMRRFDRQVAVNVRAPFALVSAALPLLRATAKKDPTRGSRIIAIASLEGIYPEEGLSAYGATKAALISLVRSINLEEAEFGVSASAISPGFVDTEMTEWVKDSIPREKMISVEDVAKVATLILDLSPMAVLPHVIINRAGRDAYRA